MDLVFYLLLIAVLGYEATALATRRRGDTISEHSWDLRIRFPIWGGLALDVLLVWLLYHISIDQLLGIVGPSWIDLVLIAVTIVVFAPLERKFADRLKR